MQGNAIDEMMSRRIERLDWPMTMRTLILDQYVAQAVAQGIDMVIDLAAGLDARPYRLSLPKELVWVDVDLPDITAHKNEVLADATPNCKVERIVVDLADGPARQALFTELGSRTKKALIITEHPK